MWKAVEGCRRLRSRVTGEGQGSRLGAVGMELGPCLPEKLIQ